MNCSVDVLKSTEIVLMKYLCFWSIAGDQNNSVVLLLAIILEQNFEHSFVSFINQKL